MAGGLQVAVAAAGALERLAAGAVRVAVDLDDELLRAPVTSTS
jgi:hypothetical protein